MQMGIKIYETKVLTLLHAMGIKLAVNWVKIDSKKLHVCFPRLYFSSYLIPLFN